MPFYDRQCEGCGDVRIDVLEKVHTTASPCPQCGGATTRVWIGKASTVIGDEIDLMVPHGVCHEDGTPRRFRSRSELAFALKEKGLFNRVEHVPARGSDKSRFTSRWI